MVCIIRPSQASWASASALTSVTTLLLLSLPGLVTAATITTTPSSSASSASSALPIFESLAELPRGWTRLAPAHPDEPVRLRVSLRQQNLDAFYEGLLHVSTPDHPRYGQHYQGPELRRLLRPAAAATATTVAWLRSHNVSTVRDDGDYLFVQTDVATASRLLDAEFAWFRYADDPREPPLLRTTQYAVPAAVAAHINFVQPTTRFGRTRPLASHVDVLDPGTPSTGESKWVPMTEAEFKANAATATTVNATCATSITPQCLFQLYNINLKGSAAGNNSVGYASFVGQAARFRDMATFAQVYAPFAAARNFSVTTFNGGVDDQTSAADAGEANLDQQYVAALSSDMPVTEFITGGLGQLVPDGDSPTPAANSNEPFLEFAMGLLALDNAQIPNSISVSYGENEQEIPPAYATQVCNLFAQLGARGKTILIASGDSGTGDFCLANDGSNATRFQPQFPGSCPYVTAVGGTSGIAPEVAQSFSSGGFSNLFARPAYQDAVVTTYLQTTYGPATNNNFSGLFNASGRGFPDVATQAVNFRIIAAGRDQAVRGTSAAAPTFNGMVALLNTARIQAGLPTMGFLNPFLYSANVSAATAMNDVTTGTSTGCNGLARFNGPPNGSPVVPNAGWAAATGWE